MFQAVDGEHLLRDKTRSCKRLFERCLNTIPDLDNDDWLEQKCAEFNWWSSGLNADKRGPGSLDSRLRLRPDVRDAVVNLLEGLEAALSKCQEIALSIRMPEAVSASESDDDDDDDETSPALLDCARPASPWSDMTDSSHGSEDQSHNSINAEDVEPCPDPYHEQRFYIKINTEILIRIHTMIKIAGLKFRNERADDALEMAEAEYHRQRQLSGTHEALFGKNSQFGEHERFRRFLTNLVLWNGYNNSLIQYLIRRIGILADEVGEHHPDTLVQQKLLAVFRAYFRDPARLTPVQSRLINANVVRRNRLIHAGKAARKPSAIQPQTPQIPETKPVAKLIVPKNMERNTADSIPIPKAPSISKSQNNNKPKTETSFVTLPATILEPSFSITSALSPPKPTKSAVTKMSARVANLDYPKCPAKKGTFQCPYCSSLLSQEYTNKKRWRAHVAQDLCAYVCVHEDCQTPDEMYVSTLDWMSHMAQCHSIVEWVCHKCTSDVSNISIVFYKDPSQFKNHILQSHAGLEQSEIDLLIESGKRYAGIHKVRCPLCRPGIVAFGPDEDEGDDYLAPTHHYESEIELIQLEDDDHIATHIHGFALQSIPCLDSAESETATSDSSLSTRQEITFQASTTEFGEKKLYNDSLAKEMLASIILDSFHLLTQMPDRSPAISRFLALIQSIETDIEGFTLSDDEEFLLTLNKSRITVSELDNMFSNSLVQAKTKESELFEELDIHFTELRLFWQKSYLLIEDCKFEDSIALQRENYHLAWVCVRPMERVAAIAMLDHIHPHLQKPPYDPNLYDLGSIGYHDIVIISPPYGQNMAGTSTEIMEYAMEHFSRIKLALLVGIGGGIPPGLQLGDVVVSRPAIDGPGIMQWELNMTETNSIKRTEMISPPIWLKDTLETLKSKQRLVEYNSLQHLQNLGEKWPRPALNYQKPNPLTDLLFNADYDHVCKSLIPNAIKADEQGVTCPDCDKNQVVKARPREMCFWYGAIASGNHTIKSGAFRDRLNEEFGGNVYCVDTEAVGLVKDFPCVMIRGICDYADSHANEVWRNHAAAMSAAFAKEFLQHLRFQDVYMAASITELVSFN